MLQDVDNRHAPPNILNLFTRSKQIHSYPTRSAIAGNFHVEMSRTDQRLLSFSRIGTKIWNGIPPEIRQLKKSHFKRKLNELLLKFLKIEEMNVDMRYIIFRSIWLFFNSYVEYLRSFIYIFYYLFIFFLFV